MSRFRITTFTLSAAMLLCSSLPAAAAPETAPGLSAAKTAALLAGMATEGFSTDAKRQKRIDTYAAGVETKWARFKKRIGDPMTAWSRTALAQSPGETVFYPFAGPDFPTIAQLYPDASRYVLVALQTGGTVPKLDAMNSKHLRLYLDLFQEGFSDFTRRGYFRTDDLKADTGHDRTIRGVTPVLMAFAARMGFTVTSVTPMQIAADGSALQPHTGDLDAIATWDNVRLALKAADGRDVTLDYVHLDLSDGYLKKHEAAKTWLTAMAGHRTFTKAASHLMQKPFFSIVRDALLGHAPSIVQDETGIDYTDLKKRFDIKLYGDFDRAHKLWTEGVQRGLAEAYKRAKDVPRLPFRVGYAKDAGYCLQVANRTE